MSRYGRVTAGVIAVWFIVALTVSARHGLMGAQGAPPIALGIAALTPMLGFLLWFWMSAGFRRFLFSLSPRTLTFVQSWRIGGFVFLVLYSAGILPGLFALPAGWGDIAIGATAPLVALYLAKPDRRAGFVWWQLLGVLDLVTAITLGPMAERINPHGVGTAVMEVLPLSLIPTFAVPLLMMLHFICIAQARQWKERRVTGAMTSLA